jgi:DUF4097 and DUF4098 domain-containing protein YvlB
MATTVNRDFRTQPILCAALVVLALASVPAAARAQTVVRTRVDTTLAFGKGGLVDLGLISGDIIVTGWTRPEVRVVARIEEGELETIITSSRISIQTQSRRRRVGEAQYEVHVPIGTRVQASSISGDIRVTGTAGEVQANSISGAVEVTDATDRISVGSVSGDLRAAKLRGRTHISTTSGDLELDDITGELSVESVSSDIKITRAKSAHVRAGTVSGEVTYAGSIEPDGSYEFSTHSGEVRLEIPAGSGASLDLQTFSGSITSSFPMTLQPGERSRHSGRKMQFTIGNGSARITAQTFSGDITIERTGRSGKEE